MANVSKNHISIVAIGRQNPQILTVDFLRSQGIVPENKPPFSECFRGERPFTQFISTPPFTKLVLETVEFIVDEQRFQVRDNRVEDWLESDVVEITQKYFQVLPHTPLKIVGVNLNSMISFDSNDESDKFQSLFLPKDSRIFGIVSAESVTANTVLQYTYPENSGRVTLTFERPNKERTKRGINFNYEFDFVNWDGFFSELGKLKQVAEYSDEIIKKLLEAL